MMKELRIKELDVDAMIQPTTNSLDKNLSQKLVVVGKPGTGKTTLITSLMYKKRHLLPACLIVSGTEDSNSHYGKIVPESFVHNKYSEELIDKFILRQKLAKKHLSQPWSLLLLDDCADDPKIFNKTQFHSIFKNGRHWKLLFLLSLQYSGDLRPVIRTNIDGCFLLKENILRNRRVLYENYAGCIPTFQLFCQLMDALTSDYCALYINNSSQSNELEDMVFYYKAKPPPDDFKFGCKDLYKFHNHRFNPNAGYKI